jgi:hypothetical protein
VLRRPPTAPSRLYSIADALDVVRNVLIAEPDTTALVLVDRRPPHEGLVACCSGPFALADLDRLDACVLEATLLAEAGCRMVLASRAPTRGSGESVADDDLAAPRPPDEAALALWRRFQTRHRPTPVPLLDWLVVGGGTVISYAALAGPPAQWRPPVTREAAPGRRGSAEYRIARSRNAG